MRKRRTHRIGHTEAERLIAGDHLGPEHAGLRNLLDAARAPATAQELAGEKAAVAAFTAHRRRAARTALRTSARRTAVAATTALALLALGGTAVAARTGNLPQDAQQHAHRLFSALGVPAPRTGPTPVVTHPSPTPAPSITALSWCDAWHGGTPLSSAERRKLVDAAAGEKGVTRYCDDLRRSSSASTPAPGRPGPGRSAPPGGTPPSAGTVPSGGTAAPPSAVGRPPDGGSAPTAGQSPPSPRSAHPKINVTDR